MLQLQFLGNVRRCTNQISQCFCHCYSCVNPHSKQRKIPWILIDRGEATQHQILKTSLSLIDLKLICITHAHGDHCYGLLGLLSSMAVLKRTIICPKDLQTFIEMAQTLTHAHHHFEIKYVHHENSTDYHLKISKQHYINIQGIILSHRISCMGFKITQHLQYVYLHGDKLLAKNIQPYAIWGKLQHGFDVTLNDGEILHADDYQELKNDELSIIVACDNDQPELLTPYLKNVQFIVHEATYTHDIYENIKSRKDDFNPKHSCAKQIAEFAQQQQVPYLALTHFSGRYLPFADIYNPTPNMAHLKAEVQHFYTGKFWLAKDFLTLKISTNGVHD